MVQRKRNAGLAMEIPVTMEIPATAEKSSISQLLMDVINFLLYQRQQIPEPIQLLERDYSDKHLNNHKSSMKSNSVKTRQQATLRKQVSKLLVNISKLKASLYEIFNVKDVIQVDLVIGATPMSPKEVFCINLSQFITDGKSTPVPTRSITLCSRKLCTTLLSGDEFFLNSPALSSIHLMVKAKKGSSVPGWQPWLNYRPKEDKIKLRITPIPIGINQKDEENKENITAVSQSGKKDFAENKLINERTGKPQPLQQRKNLNKVNTNSYQSVKQRALQERPDFTKHELETTHVQDAVVRTLSHQKKTILDGIVLNENIVAHQKDSLNVKSELENETENYGLSNTTPELIRPHGKLRNVTSPEPKHFLTSCKQKNNSERIDEKLSNSIDTISGNEKEDFYKKTKSMTMENARLSDSFSNLLGGDALGNISLDSTGTDAEIDKIFEVASAQIVTSLDNKKLTKYGNENVNTDSSSEAKIETNEIDDDKCIHKVSTVTNLDDPKHESSSNKTELLNSSYKFKNEDTEANASDSFSDSFAFDNYEHTDMDLVECEQSFIIFGNENDAQRYKTDISVSNEDRSNFEEIFDSGEKEQKNENSVSSEVKITDRESNSTQSNKEKDFNEADSENCNVPDGEVVKLRRLSKGEPTITRVESEVIADVEGKESVEAEIFDGKSIGGNGSGNSVTLGHGLDKMIDLFKKDSFLDISSSSEKEIELSTDNLSDSLEKPVVLPVDEAQSMDSIVGELSSSIVSPKADLENYGCESALLNSKIAGNQNSVAQIENNLSECEENTVKSIKLRRLSKGEADRKSDDKITSEREIRESHETRVEMMSDIKAENFAETCDSELKSKSESDETLMEFPAQGLENDSTEECTVAKINLRRISLGEISKSTAADEVAPSVTCKTEYLDDTGDVDNITSLVLDRSKNLNESEAPISTIVQENKDNSALEMSQHTASALNKIPTSYLSTSTIESVENSESTQASVCSITDSSDRPRPLATDEDTFSEPLPLKELTKLKLRDLALKKDQRISQIIGSTVCKENAEELGTGNQDDITSCKAEYIPKVDSKPDRTANVFDSTDKEIKRLRSSNISDALEDISKADKKMNINEDDLIWFKSTVVIKGFKF